MPAITKRLRFRILQRDGFKCRYCGRAAADVVLTVDHITPVSEGGSDDPTNLVAACGDCNTGKGDRVLPPEVTPIALALVPHVPLSDVNERLTYLWESWYPLFWDAARLDDGHARRLAAELSVDEFDQLFDDFLAGEYLKQTNEVLWGAFVARCDAYLRERP